MRTQDTLTTQSNTSPRRLRPGILAFCCLCLLWLIAGAAQAQSTLTALITGAQTTVGSTALTLDVYFSLQDSDGRPNPQAQVQSAKFLLESGDTYDAAVSRPPLYVALLFDSSGSMKNLLPGMKQAAIEMIAAAPPETQFAIIQFDEVITLQQTFTNDIADTLNAIDQISASDKGTCFYDGLYTTIQSITQVAQDTPRQAIVLFSDGHDERRQGAGDTCSQNNYEQLITLISSRRQPPRIYPIGVARTFRQLNLDVLRGIADASSGQFQDGAGDNIPETFFETIYNDMNSQWQATANLYPTQGQQRGALLLTLTDGQSPPPAPLTFVSERSYVTPPPPVTAVIRNFMYDAGSNSYFFDVTLSGHARVVALSAEIIDAANNQQITRTPPQPISWETERMVLDARLLQADHTYVARVYPLDADGKPLVNETSGDGTLGDGEEVIAEYPFRHEPPPPPLVVRIDAITISDDEPQFNWRTRQIEDEPAQLTLSLFLENGAQIAQYDGYFLNSSNQRVQAFTLLLQTDNTAQLPFVAESGAYTAVIHALNETGTRLATAEYRFDYTRPTNVPVRAWEALQANPILYLVGLLALLLATLLAWLLGFVSGRLSEHNRYRRHARQAAQAQAQETSLDMQTLQVHILESLDAAIVNAEGLKVTHFPYTIGRSDCDLNIVGDQHISRKHAQITWVDGRFYLEDNHSRNGTFVNESKVEPNTPFQLAMNHGDRIRIGKTTTLTLQPAVNGHQEAVNGKVNGNR